MNNTILKKIAVILTLVLIAAVSSFYCADKLAAPEIYENKIHSIDEKAETVLKLTATSTLASAGISAIPGDTATPIANKLADFSQYFLLILSVLYSEKYLMTLIPSGACRFLVPIICGVFIAGRIVKNAAIDRLGYKLLFVTLCVSLVIPLSIGASDMIYDAYRQSIEATITSAEELTDETSPLTNEEDKGVIQSILSKLSETTETLTNKASNILNRFVETLAVMIVTSCVIPLAVLLFFLWIIRILTGVDLTDHSRRFHEQRRGRVTEREREESDFT